MNKFKSENHQRILAFLKLIAASKGLRVRDLARANGISGTAIYNALYEPWPKGEKILSDILGIKPQVLWPERYDQEGRRIRGQRRNNSMADKITQENF